LSGNIGGISIIFRDISNHKRAEEVQARLAAIVDASDDAILSRDLEGRILSWNAGAEKMFGYAAAEAVGRSITIIAPPERQHEAKHNTWLVQHGKRVPSFETVCVAKDGHPVHVQISVSAIRDNAGNVTRIAAIFRDIAERKQADEELRRSRALLNSVVENIPGMIFLKNASDLSYALFNRAGEELIGLAKEEVLGKRDHDLFPKEQADFFIAKDKAVLATGKVLEVPEESIQTPNGTRILHTKKIPLLDDGGTPQYLLGISEDITDRLAPEASLHRERGIDVGANAYIVKSSFDQSNLLEIVRRLI
jgi:PAS domain S-box-containing protein